MKLMSAAAYMQKIFEEITKISEEERKMATYDEVKAVLEKVRPSLQRDGGDVEFVDFKDNKVYLRLMGHCRGCPYSEMTLRNGIQRILNQQLDPSLEVVGVD